MNNLSFQRNLRIHEPYDLVVCGGGPSGLAAALAARRTGLKVLIVEGQGQLGGMSTSGLVSQWLGGRTDDCSKWVVGGLFRTLSQEAASLNHAVIPKTNPNEKYQPYGWHKGQSEAGIPLDPYEMAFFLDQKIADAGVDVLLHTQAVDVCLADEKITHIVVFNKSGLMAIPSAAVIDATGDADIAARSGCAVIKGRDSDGLMTPVTLEFHVDNVDQDALSDYIHKHESPRFKEKICQLREAGEWPFPYEIFITTQLVEKGTMMINTSRITGIDGCDGQSVTSGMVQGRQETQKLLAVMRKHFPGFANVRLKAVAPLLGVRETRRIQGKLVLKVSDLVDGQKYDDTVGYSAYGWDLPDPIRPSYQPMWETNAAPVHKVKKKTVTPIPYRLMLPQPIKNLICPGRAVSVDRDVLGPLRVMAPCFAMGEAAGQAAKQVINDNVCFDEVDVQVLREELRSNDAIVDWCDQ